MKNAIKSLLPETFRRLEEAIALNDIHCAERGRIGGDGLPLMAVGSWDELSGMTAYELKAKCDLMMSAARMEPLHMEYWRSLIDAA
jgi:hypothetical protein